MRILFFLLCLIPTSLFAGGKTNTFATVGSTTTAIVAANDRRMSLVIVNDSDENMYLGVGVSAVLGRGIRLNSGGGVYSCSRNCPKEAINGITSGGSDNATVYEEQY